MVGICVGMIHIMGRVCQGGVGAFVAGDSRREIPAFAGMTWVGAGMAWEGVGMTLECVGMTLECAGVTLECVGVTWECAGMA